MFQGRDKVKASSWQSQGKVKVRFRQGKSKVKERARPFREARTRQDKCKVKAKQPERKLQFNGF